jgi:DNA-binding transcriptional LysR family regulator
LFLTDARRILQDVEEAKRRAERIALGKAGTLRIEIAMALSWHGMVVESFREFRRRQPDAELVVRHLISIHQGEAVLSDRLDAGFAAAVTVEQGFGTLGVRAGQNFTYSAQRSSPNKTRKDSVA